MIKDTILHIIHTRVAQYTAEKKAIAHFNT